MMQHRRAQTNFVQVAAKTASPIVSSVPKCKNSKAFRLHPMDTINGALESGSRSLMQPDEQVIARSYKRTDFSTDDLSLYPSYTGAERHHDDNDRVVLIFDDDRGGGIPVIGRRLPSKSARAVQQQQEFQYRLAASNQIAKTIDYSQPTTIQVPEHHHYPFTSNLQQQLAATSKPSKQPVAGRRSHRIQQQTHLMASASRDKSRDFMAATGRLQLVVSPSAGQHSSGQNFNNNHKVSSLTPLVCSTSGSPTCAHPFPALEYSSTPIGVAHTGAAASNSRRSRKGSAKTSRADHVASETLLQPAGSHPTLLCCPELVAAPPPGACPNPRCCPPLPEPATVDALECSNPQCCPQLGLNGESERIHRRPRSQRLTYGAGDRSARARPAEHQAQAEAYRRASSCSERRALGPRSLRPVNALPVSAKPQLSHMRANHERLSQMELSKQQRSNHRLGAGASLVGQDEEPSVEAAAAAVTQMYESLAAELKAKLGNPKTAPILLPPKDYDTLSRKQGKLTGIELRRSTNPQLVGPAANFALLASANLRHPLMASTKELDELEATQEGGGHADRVMGHLEVGVPGANRQNAEANRNNNNSNSTSMMTTNHPFANSLSNSSSGLGSILCSSSSPNSSIESSAASQQQQSRRLVAPAPARPTPSAKTSSESISKHQSGKRLSSPNCCDADSGHHGSETASSGNDRSGLSSGGSGASSNRSPPSSSLSSSCSPSGSPSASPSSPSSPVFSPGHATGYADHRLPTGIQQQELATKASAGVLWNGRVEVPLKINSAKNGNTYLATKQIIY